MSSQREHRYEIEGKLNYDLGRKFTLITDFDTYISTWFSGRGKRSLPYGLTIGAGIEYNNTLIEREDYKDNILTGINISHYHLRNQDFPDEDGYETYSGYHKGFLFKAYVGYGLKKEFGENGTISLLGKVSADVDSLYFSRKEELDYMGTKKLLKEAGSYLENRTHLHVIPELRLGYKLNKNFEVEVEYSGLLSLSRVFTYAGMRNKIRTGVKYTWER
ncbi:hypothetical protein NQ652_17735 [Acinetobacter baumannii]|nr:hypothetical protein [Acinetobacter baumannii]